MKTQNAIIIGASSGIGRALGKILAQNGYTVGLTARRIELLEELQKEIPTRTFIQKMDVSKPQEAQKLLEELITRMGGMDLLVVNAGLWKANPRLEWNIEQEAIDINVTGFVAMANFGMTWFINQGFGHLVGLSSVGAIHGHREAPAYFAAKAFIANYLQGLRHYVGKQKIPIAITDIRPGHVDTPGIRGEEDLFWVAPVEKAARQIFEAIRHKRKLAYITHRWRLIAWVLRVIPDFLFNRI
jgi:short-subunit dehydrogenase